MEGPAPGILTCRIIPKLDIKNNTVVKGVHLEGLRVVGAPNIMAEHYYETLADEIIYSDVVASLYGRNNLAELVEEVSRRVFVPLVVGGGIRSLEDIESLLRAGADKVAVNSWAIQNPEFINRAAGTFGAQCIIGQVEAKQRPDGSWEALYNCGRERSGRDALLWARELEDRGAGELLLISVDRDGTGRGFDIELVQRVADTVHVPVIANGGAGSVQQVREVIEHGDASAVAISRALHTAAFTIGEVKDEIHGESTLWRAGRI